MSAKKAVSKSKPDTDLSSIIGETGFTPTMSKEIEEEVRQIMQGRQDVAEPVPEDGNDMTDDQVNVVSNSGQDEAGEPIKPSEVQDEALPAKPRTGSRQRKASFEEYRKLFLETPRIGDRKTVFISGTLRDKLDEVARKLGDRKMSVSGFIENLIRHHLDVYEEDLNAWKKL